MSAPRFVHLRVRSEYSISDSIVRIDPLIEAAAAELRTALEGSDATAIRQKADALQEASYALAEQVYKDAQQSAPSGDGASAADDESDEEIIEDAEVVDPDAATAEK